MASVTGRPLLSAIHPNSLGWWFRPCTHDRGRRNVKGVVGCNAKGNALGSQLDRSTSPGGLSTMIYTPFLYSWIGSHTLQRRQG